MVLITTFLQDLVQVVIQETEGQVGQHQMRALAAGAALEECLQAYALIHVVTIQAEVAAVVVLGY